MMLRESMDLPVGSPLAKTNCPFLFLKAAVFQMVSKKREGSLVPKPSGQALFVVVADRGAEGSNPDEALEKVIASVRPAR